MEEFEEISEIEGLANDYLEFDHLFSLAFKEGAITREDCVLYWIIQQRLNCLLEQNLISLKQPTEDSVRPFAEECSRHYRTPTEKMIKAYMKVFTDRNSRMNRRP